MPQTEQLASCSNDSALHCLEDIELDDGAPLLLRGEPEAACRGPFLHRVVSRYTLMFGEATSDRAAYVHEAGRLLQLSAPIMASSFCSFALSLVAVAFIGRVGELELSIVVLATSLYNVTALAVIVGFVGALETAAGQAFGARNYRACGVALQRCMLIALLISAGVAALWVQTEPLLLAIGQDAAIAAGVARFLHLAMPAMASVGMFESIKRFLQAEGVVAPTTVVSCAAVGLSPLLNWVLIFKLGLGVDGAVLAMDACQLAMLVGLAGYATWRARRLAGSEVQTWHGWSREALSGWPAFLRLGVPSAVMTCLEWWAYELLTLAAGWLPNPALHVAAMGVLLNLSGLLYVFPYGLAAATCVRISTALGAGLPSAARRTAVTAVALTLCTQLCLSAAVAGGRGAWARTFTDVAEVVETAALLMPILAVMVVGDGLNTACGGMLRGAGRQGLGALLMLGSFWGVGIPTAALLAFPVGWGVYGLSWGIALATTLQGVIMLVMLARFDWRGEARKAQERFACEHGTAGLGSPEPSSAGKPVSELALAERGDSTHANLPPTPVGGDAAPAGALLPGGVGRPLPGRATSSRRMNE